MRTVDIYRGRKIIETALVDDADYLVVACHKWGMKNGGYAGRHTSKDGRRIVIYMHRELLQLGSGREIEVDHINRIRLDNRRENLRICTHAENQQNRSSNRNSKTGVRGVCWHKGQRKWHANVRRGSVRIYSEFFDSLGEAAEAVKAARAVLMPFSEEHAA